MWKHICSDVRDQMRSRRVRRRVGKVDPSRCTHRNCGAAGVRSPRCFWL